LCAGSTLNPPTRVVNVHVGGNTRTSQRVFLTQRIIQHPLYVHTPRANDIGIIILAQTLRFDLTVRPIALPSEDKVNLLTDNAQGLVLGFGGMAQNNQQFGSGQIRKDF
jgi:hypothetical protein